MSISLYKPNSKNAGCAFKFSIGQNKKKEPVLYVSAIQQFEWNESRKIGSFSGNGSNPDKKISLKFTEFEVGGMISSFRHRNEYSSFHSFDDNKTSIKFTPWDKKSKVKKGDKEEWVTLPAFGITFTRNGNQTFRIPLEPGEVENLTEFLRYFLKTLYSHRKEQEEILLKEYRSKNSTQSSYNDASKSEDVPF
tara:strand:- start:3919 stop:4497 length:579 start_codon:yes stop_codon:yes gene_type:complete